MSGACRVAGAYPLTFQQYARLERARQAAAAGGAARSNVVPSSCNVTGPLSREAVGSAAIAVARRHPAVRLAFPGSSQVVAPCSTAHVSMSDAADAAVVLPLAEPSRLALTVAQAAPDHFRLTAYADHLAFDGTSIEVFWRDFWAAYAAAMGADGPADELGCGCDPSFLEFAAATRSAQARPSIESAAAELRAADSPLGFAQFPVRLPLAEIGSRSVAAHTVDLGESWWPSFVEYARTNRCTPFVAATAAVLAAIGEQAPGSRPMLYTYLQNRRTAAEQQAIGWFAATVLLIAADTIDLRSVRSVVNTALAHGDADTEMLHRRCGDGQRAATMPSVSLALTPTGPADFATQVGNLCVRRAPIEGADRWLPRGRLAVDLAAAGRLTVSYEVERFAAEVVTDFADAIATHLTPPPLPLPLLTRRS